MGIVTLTQFVHPNGRPRPTQIELPDEICEMAGRQSLSCECMPNDYSKVVFYSHPFGRDPDEDPGCECVMTADNGPGGNSPKIVLEKLIRQVDANIAEEAK